MLSGSILTILLKIETTKDFPTFLFVRCLQGSLEFFFLLKENERKHIRRHIRLKIHSP